MGMFGWIFSGMRNNSRSGLQIYRNRIPHDSADQTARPLAQQSLKIPKFKRMLAETGITKIFHHPTDYHFSGTQIHVPQYKQGACALQAE